MGHEIDAKALRAHLLTTLPEHMVPTTFVRLDALPRTPNGKIDRRALAAASLAAEPQLQFVAPQTPGELAVATIWSDVLGAPRVGLRDNFFELGGHSISAMLIVSRLRAHFAVELTLSAVFDFPTVGELATHLATLQSVRDIVRPVREPTGEEVEDGAV